MLRFLCIAQKHIKGYKNRFSIGFLHNWHCRKRCINQLGNKYSREADIN